MALSSRKEKKSSSKNKLLQNHCASEKTRRGFFVKAACAALFLALLLRAVCCWELASFNNMMNAVFSPSAATDLATYMRLAKEISQGIIPQTFYYQPYYYAVFLPLILLTGGGVISVIAVQTICGVAATLFAMLSALKFAGRKAAIFAGILTATSVPLIFYTPYHQNETLQSLHLVLFLFCGICALQKGRLYLFAATGAVSGIAVATRGNIALISIFFGILSLIFPLRYKITRKLLNTLLFAAVTLAVLSPFALRNTLSLGKLTGASTAGDAVLALGNTPEAPAGGRNPGLPAGPMEYPEAFHRTMSDTAHGVGLGKAMFNWMCREPLAFFELQFRKILLFWDAREIPNNVSLASDGRTSSLLTFLRNCGFEYLLIICGLAGLLIIPLCARIRDARFWWLGGFIVIYWGSIALFYNLSRFRAPILPVLAVAGALLLRRRKRGRRAHIAAALLFSLFICVFAYDTYRSFEPQIMRFIRPDGTIVPPAIGYFESDVLDHGPITFGGWGEIPLKEGDILQKEFSVSGKGKVLWKIFSASEGYMAYDCGSGKIDTFELKAGENTLELSVSDVKNSGFTVVCVPEKVFAVCDYQRDYARSRFNGKVLPSEWVARCRLPLDKEMKKRYNK